MALACGSVASDFRRENFAIGQKMKIRFLCCMRENYWCYFGEEIRAEHVFKNSGNRACYLDEKSKNPYLEVTTQPKKGLDAAAPETEAIR